MLRPETLPNTPCWFARSLSGIVIFFAAVTSAAPLPALACGTSAAAQPNLRNGTFENGLDGWTPRLSENMGEVRLVDDGAGGKCAQFHKTVATPDWSCIGVTQEVAVDANSEYVVSLRFRTALKQGIVGYACRVFATGEGLDDHRTMSPSDEWAPFEWQFSTGVETKEIQLQLVLTYSSGDLWVDDVTLRKVGSSIEAEDFAEKTDASPVADEGLSGARGIELGAAGSISTPLKLDAGVWRIEVFGEGAEAEQGLTRRAVTVQIGARSQTIDLHRHGTKYHGRVAYLRTDQAGEQNLIIGRAGDFAGRLVLDRVSWVAYRGPDEARPLCRETQLVRDGKPNAVIVAGPDAAMQRAARTSAVGGSAEVGCGTAPGRSRAMDVRRPPIAACHRRRQHATEQADRAALLPVVHVRGLLVSRPGRMGGTHRSRSMGNEQERDRAGRQRRRRHGRCRGAIRTDARRRGIT